MTTDKSFEEMTNSELFAVAKEFGTVVHHRSNKKTLLEKLEEDGVTFQMWNELVRDSAVYDEQPIFDDVDEQVDGTPVTPEPVVVTEVVEVPVPVVVEPEEPEFQVIKMTRKNATYEIRGYRFTQQHPYALVAADDADYLIETGGFRPVSPKEFKAFYAAD